MYPRGSFHAYACVLYWQWPLCLQLHRPLFLPNEHAGLYSPYFLNQ